MVLLLFLSYGVMSESHPSSHASICIRRYLNTYSYLYVGKRARQDDESSDGSNSNSTHSSNHSSDESSTAPPDDDLGPDDPNWSLAQDSASKIEPWFMRIVAVVGRRAKYGTPLTFVVGHGYYTANDLLRECAERLQPIWPYASRHCLACLNIDTLFRYLENAHPEEMMLTDDLQVARAHHIVDEAIPIPLATTRPIIPPPVTSEKPFIYVIPGFLHELGHERVVISHADLHFAAESDVAVVSCAHSVCESGGEYNRACDTVRMCPRCSRWFHEICLLDSLGDPQASFPGGSWTSDVTQETFNARPIRRSPRPHQPSTVLLARGIRLAATPPVATWERAIFPFFWVYGEGGFHNLREGQHWLEWCDRVISNPDARLAPMIPQAVLQGVVDALFPPADPQFPRDLVFVCPYCHTTM